MKFLLKFEKESLEMDGKKIKVKLIRSLIGTKKSHRATIRGLGLKRINSVSTLIDSMPIRGMIKKVSYLVDIVK